MKSVRSYLNDGSRWWYGCLGIEGDPHWRRRLLCIALMAASLCVLFAMAVLSGLAAQALALIVALLLFDITPTASVIEFLWTIPSAFVFIRYARRAWRAFLSYCTFQKHNAPLTLRLRERIRTRRFLSLAVIAEFLLGIGILAMLQEPTVYAEHWQPISIMSGLFMFGIMLVLGLKGEVVDRDERALAWLYQQQIRMGNGHAERDDDMNGTMADGQPNVH